MVTSIGTMVLYTVLLQKLINLFLNLYYLFTCIFLPVALLLSIPIMNMQTFHNEEQGNFYFHLSENVLSSSESPQMAVTSTKIIVLRETCIFTFLAGTLHAF